jgi:hypothetical protein
MKRQQILSEIQRLASIGGGTPPGRVAFERATGIRESDWYPHLWLRWGEALSEAGYTPNKMNASLGEGEILERYVGLIRELGRAPVSGELRRKAHADETFPSHNTFSKFGGKTALIEKVSDYCKDRSEHRDVELLLPPSHADAASDVLSARAPVQGYVYMMRSGRHYKIGFTNSPVRRHREVRIELPDPTHLIYSIETDDPTGIET